MRSIVSKFATILVFSALLGACDNSSSSADDSGSPASKDPTGTGTGTSGKEAFTITFEIAPLDATHALIIQRDTSRNCDEDVLVTDIDIDTSRITLTSANVIVDDDIDTVLVDGKPHTQTARLKRIGSGSGFDGKWSLEEVLTPLSGVDPEGIDETHTKMFDSSWVEVSGKKAVEHIVGFRYGVLTRDMLESYKQQLQRFPGITYSVSSDSSAFTVSSTKTAETATIKIGLNSRGPVVTVSSSVSEHASFTQGEDPASCPEPDEPAWFMNFLSTIAGAPSGSTLLEGSPKIGF